MTLGGKQNLQSLWEDGAAGEGCLTTYAESNGTTFAAGEPVSGCWLSASAA